MLTSNRSTIIYGAAGTNLRRKRLLHRQFATNMVILFERGRGSNVSRSGRVHVDSHRGSGFRGMSATDKGADSASISIPDSR